MTIEDLLQQKIQHIPFNQKKVLDRKMQELTAIIWLWGYAFPMVWILADGVQEDTKWYSYGLPSVHFSSPEAKELRMKRHEYVKQKDSPDFDVQVLDKLTADLMWANLRAEEKMLRFLDEFYEDRRVDFSIRLIVEGNDFIGSVLKSQGANTRPLRDVETQKEDLAAYMAEMSAFSDFLIAKARASMQEDKRPFWGKPQDA